VQEYTLSQVKQLEKLQVRNLFIRVERLLDNGQPLDFIPLVILTCHSDSDVTHYRKGENLIDTVMFCIYSVEKQNIVDHSSCNSSPQDMRDLSPLSIEIVRSSNIETEV
jgi:hypothetical protein